MTASSNPTKKYSNEDLTKWKQEIHAVPIIARRVNIRRENDEWVGLCPFHTEKTPSFKVWKGDDGIWLFNCFGCGQQGNVFQFVERFDKVSFARSVEIVREEAGTIDPATVEAPIGKKKIVTFTMAEYAQCERALESSAEGKAWIEARGITMETARRFHLGFVQDATKVCGTDHPWRAEGWVTFPTLSLDTPPVVQAIKYRSLVGKKEMVDGKSVSGILRAQNTATLIYNLYEVNQFEDVFFCEGEPDTLVLSQTGTPAVGLPTAQYKPTLEDLGIISDAKRVFIAGDNDKEGTKVMDRTWRELGERTYQIRWPEGCKDANDVFLNVYKGNVSEFSIFVGHLKSEAVKRGVWQDPSKPKPTPPAEMIVEMGNQIVPEEIIWLWDNRIPFGKITLYAGNPDNGKSLAAMSAAANTTTGQNFADSVNTLKPSDVMMLLGEDDLKDTAVPRLMAAGADMSKIHFPKGMARANSNEDSEVKLDIDLPAIDAYLEKHPAIKLIVIDPISNYLGDVSMVSEQDARRVLIPLKRIVERRSIALIMIMHLNKKNDLDAINRVGGAMAFIGVARSSWLFIRDVSTEDGEAKKNSFSMAKIKNNLTPAETGGIAYHISVRPIEVLDAEKNPKMVPTPYVIWDGTITKSADDVLDAKRAPKERGRPKGSDTDLQEAIVWLQHTLQDGHVVPSKQLFKDAYDSDGISGRTLRRAGKTLGIKPEKTGTGWTWALPPMNATAVAIDGTELQDEPAGEMALIVGGVEVSK